MNYREYVSLRTGLVVLILLIMLLSVACSQRGVTETTAAPTEDVAQSPPISGTATSSSNTSTEIVPTESPVPDQLPSEVTQSVELPTSPPPSPTIQIQEQVADEPTPIEVSYFTPAQGEGPYYPVEKLADRDSDLTVLEGASDFPTGQVIEFGGGVYDANGMPVSGIVIEIWQTDSNGVYLHPNDPGTEGRDRNFQFYGEATTDENGNYHFRTILPGQYEPRPRHIHVKLKYEGRELLTTQFYFEGDPDLVDEGMFIQAAGDGVHLVISLENDQDSSGQPILVGQRDIILETEF